MQRKCSTWNEAASALAALLLLAIGAGTAIADSPLAKTDSPKPLPESIVKAWEKAGAKVCWLRVSPDGSPKIVGEKDGSPKIVGEKEGEPGDLPAFYFTVWQEESLAKLPAPRLRSGCTLPAPPM